VKAQATIWGSLLVGALLIGGSIYYQATVWNECRTGHSWLYCYHTVIK
jgi:hypothetical protein